MPIPELPPNSVIKLAEERDDVVLSWYNPRPSLAARLPTVIFLCAWLGGWAVGEYFAATKVWEMFQTGEWNFFIFFWLIGWTVGGLWAMYSIYRQLAPARPERLALGYDRLEHDPGLVPLSMNFGQQKQQPEETPAKVEKRSMPRAEVGEVHLDRVGERQRLSVDWGALRVEIGRHLQEPEREWLHRVIVDWRGA